MRSWSLLPILGDLGDTIPDWNWQSVPESEQASPELEPPTGLIVREESAMDIQCPLSARAEALPRSQAEL